MQIFSIGDNLHEDNLREVLKPVSGMETICMKCQNLFSGKNKKNIISLSSAELAQRVVIIKENGLVLIRSFCAKF